MDCQEIQQILDAYALGALGREEARPLEEHVVECLRCWEELTEAQRATAALALGVPLHRAGTALRQRTLGAARRSQGRRALPGDLASRWRSLRLPGVGVLATAAAGAAVALAVLLFIQVNDLRGDNDRLAGQLAAAQQTMDQLRQMDAVRSAPDARSVRLLGTAASPQTTGTYYWSEAMAMGVLVCNNLRALGPAQTYQVWAFVDSKALPVGTFASWKGLGEWVLDLSPLASEEIDALGVSIEPAGGSAAPSGEMILWGTLPEEY